MATGLLEHLHLLPRTERAEMLQELINGFGGVLTLAEKDAAIAALRGLPVNQRVKVCAMTMSGHAKSVECESHECIRSVKERLSEVHELSALPVQLQLFASGDERPLPDYTIIGTLIPNHYGADEGSLQCIEMSLVVHGLPQAVGISTDLLGDSCLTASSEYSVGCRVASGRLHREGARWAPATVDMKAGTAWMQVNLLGMRSIVQIATQGNGSWLEWTTNYTVTYSVDGERWSAYMEHGVVKIFEGNADQDSVVMHEFASPVTCRYMRLHPKAWYAHACIRLELFEIGQCDFVSTDANSGLSAVGISNGLLGDSCFSASSESSLRCRVATGRLHGLCGWAPAIADVIAGTSWMQVDLLGMRSIVQIATQGNGIYPQWAASYTVSHSADGCSWTSYIEDGTEKNFEGNADQETLVVHQFASPVICRFMRVSPKTWNPPASIRLELYEQG